MCLLVAEKVIVDDQKDINNYEKLYDILRRIDTQLINDSLKTRLSDTELGKDIHPAESNTKIYINRGQSGLDLDVVGDLTAIRNKLQGKKL